MTTSIIGLRDGSSKNMHPITQHAAAVGEVIPQGADAGYPVGRWRAWVTLVLLGLLYLVSFIDRVILALLVIPLKKDLQIGDTQLGLLFGTAFAVFYGVLGLPFARIADRSNRRLLIVAGALVWSISTILSGLATSFQVLVLLRFGLAVGEAALTPAAFSLIGDLFPTWRRVRAASIYSAFGMLGAGGSYIFGALLLGVLDIHLQHGMLWGFRIWQLVFFCVGTPALLLAIVFAAISREPPRSSEGDSTRIPGLRQVLGMIVGKFQLYGLLLLGAGLCQVTGYALAAWMPHYLNLRFGYTIEQAGLFYGAVSICASVGGSLAVPMLTDFVAQWRRASAFPLCSGAAALFGTIAMVLAGLQREVAPFLSCVALGLFLLTGATNNVLAGFQHLVQPRMRATMAALCLMSITLLGLGIGPPVLALLDGRGFFAAFPNASIAVLALVAALPGAACLLASARSIEPARGR